MLSVSVFCVLTFRFLFLCSDSVSVSVVFVSVLFLFSGSVVSMCLVLAYVSGSVVSCVSAVSMFCFLCSCLMVLTLLKDNKLQVLAANLKSRS